MKHIGLVISDTLVAEEVIRNHVVELIADGKSECRHVLANVSHAAFRFEASGVWDQAYVKNQRRRAERPLSFGDVIEWTDADMSNRIISKFRRMPALFDIRVSEQKFQVLVKGVVSPLDKFHFWSEYFPNVRIGIKASEDVLPNITIWVWLNLCIDEEGKFCIEFDSFERVDDEGSIVGTAPWNRNSSKYTTLKLPVIDDGLEGQILLPDSFSEMAQDLMEVRNKEGICTAKRLIFCKDLAPYEIIVALIKHVKEAVPLGIGVTCEFDAVWNEYEKKYIVTRYKTKGLPSRLGANGLMRTSVKAVEEYPGLFKSEQFGYIDDPTGALALFHLSQYKRSSVVVTLEDKPSHKAELRFRVVDVQPDKAEKLEKWIQEDEISVENVEGVVLDNTTVYSRDHANIYFQVPEEDRGSISPGQVVKFSAQYQKDSKNFVITKIYILPGRDIVSVEKDLYGSNRLQRVFRVTASKTRQFKSFLDHPLFGLIDIGVDTILRGKNKSVWTIWIARSLVDEEIEEDESPLYHSPFFLVSFGDREPENKILCRKSVEGTSTSAESSKSPVDFSNNATDTIEKAMERIGLTGGQPCIVHADECTQSTCASECPTMQAVMMLTEKVQNFWEVLFNNNPAFFTELVNKIFK